MQKHFLVAAVTLSSILPGTIDRPKAVEPEGDMVLRSLRHDGMTRWYRVYTPPSYDPSLPTPVVFAFHGYTMNAKQMAKSYGIRKLADTEGYIAVFPEGTGALGGWPLFLYQSWNAGHCCGFAIRNNVDDVGFIDELIDQVAEAWNVDMARVFATGMSNGAMLSYRLAAELPDRFAAIAPVAGNRPIDDIPTEPIPVIAFHGALDCLVPSGAPGCPAEEGSPTQRESLQPFFAVNACVLPNGNRPTEVVGDALLFEAPARETGADIHYWWLEDGGHTWPGHPIIGMDRVNLDIDATAEMWAFFEDHPAPRTGARNRAADVPSAPQALRTTAPY